MGFKKINSLKVSLFVVYRTQDQRGMHVKRGCVLLGWGRCMAESLSDQDEGR